MNWVRVGSIARVNQVNQQDVSLAAQRVLEVTGSAEKKDLGLQNTSSTLIEAKAYRYLSIMAQAEKKEP